MWKGLGFLSASSKSCHYIQNFQRYQYRCIASISKEVDWNRLNVLCLSESIPEIRLELMKIENHNQDKSIESLQKNQIVSNNGTRLGVIIGNLLSNDSTKSQFYLLLKILQIFNKDNNSKYIFFSGMREIINRCVKYGQIEYAAVAYLQLVSNGHILDKVSLENLIQSLCIHGNLELLSLILDMTIINENVLILISEIFIMSGKLSKYYSYFKRYIKRVVSPSSLSSAITSIMTARMRRSFGRCDPLPEEIYFMGKIFASIEAYNQAYCIRNNILDMTKLETYFAYLQLYKIESEFLNLKKSHKHQDLSLRFLPYLDVNDLPFLCEDRFLPDGITLEINDLTSSIENRKGGISHLMLYSSKIFPEAYKMELLNLRKNNRIFSFLSNVFSQSKEFMVVKSTKTGYEQDYDPSTIASDDFDEDKDNAVSDKELSSEDEEEYDEEDDDEDYDEDDEEDYDDEDEDDEEYDDDDHEDDLHNKSVMFPPGIGNSIIPSLKNEASRFNLGDFSQFKGNEQNDVEILENGAIVFRGGSDEDEDNLDNLLHDTSDFEFPFKNSYNESHRKYSNDIQMYHLIRYLESIASISQKKSLPLIPPDLTKSSPFISNWKFRAMKILHEDCYLNIKEDDDELLSTRFFDKYYSFNISDERNSSS